MMNLIKKFGALLGGLILGIFYLFGKKDRNNSPDSPSKSKETELVNKLKDLDKKEKELKEKGVKDLTDQEEIDYWKN